MILYWERMINGITHIQAKCGDCGKGFGFMSQVQDAGEFRMFGGKHKGKMISEIYEIDSDYVRWAAKEHPVEKVKTICTAYLLFMKNENTNAAGNIVPDNKPVEAKNPPLTIDLINQKLDWIIGRMKQSERTV